jgi:formamidopyrimidine-DNA glycosylase
MRLLPTIEVPEIDFFKKVGPEPLEDDFTAHQFIDRVMRRKNTNIKAAILDQTVIAGIGNIYADEGLWGAKIHPATIVSQVPKAKLVALYSSLRAVLKLSIEKGGSSDRNYVDAKGQRGSYLAFANVFRKDGQPCPRCGTTIEKIRVAGRGTHYCPHCQKVPKQL